MKNKTLTYLVLSLLCCMSACTSVDLCPEAEHPHITDMRVPHRELSPGLDFP